MMKWFSFLLFLSTCLQAQKYVYYENVHEDDLSVRTSIHDNIIALKIKKPDEKLTYRPNAKTNINLGVSHPKLPLTLSIGFSTGNQRNPDHPSTEKIDLQVHNYGEKYVFDVFFQDYKGFYNDADLPLSEVNHPNLSMLILGGVGQYIFNHDRFSYSAGYGGKIKQLKSAGSLLVGGEIYYFNMKSDKTIIGDNNNITYKRIGATAGYSHNFVFHKNWVTNLSMNAGLNLNQNFALDFSGLIRISTYYSGDKFTAGFSAVSNKMFINSLNNKKELSGSINFGKTSFDFIYHFNL